MKRTYDVDESILNSLNGALEEGDMASALSTLQHFMEGNKLTVPFEYLKSFTEANLATLEWGFLYAELKYEDGELD